VRGVNARFGPGGVTFDIIVRDRAGGDSYTFDGVKLPMVGEYNILNALAAVAVGLELEIEEPVIRKALANFAGVKRRFTKTGEVDGISIIDDYAHHPVEIAAVLKAARRAGRGRVIGVVQPHRFTRLRDLFEEFCTCFNDADTVIVAPVHRAGEEPIEGFDRDSLIEGLRAHGHRHVLSLEGPEALAVLVDEHGKKGDFVICLGAGSITNWAHSLPDELQKLRGANTKPKAKPRTKPKPGAKR